MEFKGGYALLIGIDDNLVGEWRLPIATKDISALHDILIHPKYCAYQTNNIKVIKGTEATRQGILDGLLWLQEQTKQDPEVTSIIYYTGHGWRNTSTGPAEFYLIPYDTNKTELCLRALRAVDFAAEIQKVQSQRLIVILDCCHAAGMDVKAIDSLLPANYVSTSLPLDLFTPEGHSNCDSQAKNLRPQIRVCGRVVLNSSTGEESSYIRKDGKMSIFTYHLIDALTGHAQPQGGAEDVLISDVMSYITRKVPISAQQDHGKTQTPEYRINGNNFPMAKIPTYRIPNLHNRSISGAQNVFQSTPGYSFVSQEPDILTVALKNQFEQIADRMSSFMNDYIEKLRDAWRQGEKGQILASIRQYKSDSNLWPFLNSETKAKLLRFEANVVLQLTGDIAHAKELADEARILAPSDNESVLRAMIAYTESGPEAALPILAEQQDLDSSNLKAAFLLQMGRADEGRAFLNVETIGLQPNAETFRLRALVNLQAKAINQAQLDIQKAAEIAPRWESIRYTLAVINYFSSLSLAALPNAIVPWPEPVEWPLVKQDDESVERLRIARKAFEDLIAEAGQDAEERGRLHAWRLACLANDLEQQDTAVEYCQTILVEDATDFRALSWAVARNFEINLSNSEIALEALVQGDSATVPHVLALAGCYIRSQKADVAIQLLDSQKPLFEEAHLLPMWTLWYVQLLVADGQSDLALAYVDQMPAGEAAQLAQIVVLSAQAGQGGDWQRALESIEALYTGTQNPKYLLDSCELAARFGNWEYVADRAVEIVESLETEMALRLAVYGTFNTRQFEACLDLLNRNAKLCHHEKLPADLQRVRALCYQALGVLPSAIADLEKLVLQDPTIENLAALAQAHLEMGDLKGLVIIGRQLSKYRGLAPDIALRIAQFIQSEDLTLAQTLWRTAIAQGLSDDLVSVALDLGYRLGLDRELHEITARVVRLGQEGRGGVFMKRIEDIAEMAVQWREHRAQLEQLYLEGKAPIHLIAEQLHLSLVDFYRYQLSLNESAPNLVNSPLLARHGGRSIPLGFPEYVPGWRLHLDITSLLLANHLDLLDAVERAFAPLRIPAEAIPALIYMRNKIAPHQPSQLEIYNQMIRLTEQDAFQVVVDDISLVLAPEVADLTKDLGADWLSLLEQASANEGYLVDFLPLRKQGTSQVLSELPAIITQRVINCRSILEALHAQGPLSDEDYAQALDRLGDQGYLPPSQEVPGFGVPLYFHANTPDVLISAGVFRDVCAKFQVFIEQRELNQAKAAVKEYQQSQEIDRWLESLIARLHQGLERGIYEALPQFVDKERWGKDGRIESPEILCLFSLLRYEAKEGDVIWIDDRFSNGFARRDAAPIITIIEVLKGLVPCPD